MAELFEYAVILNEKRDKDNEVTDKGSIVVSPTTILASDEKQAELMAARAIPEEFLANEKIDRLLVVVRPF